jgi:di/tricarboxylate transporter
MFDPLGVGAVAAVAGCAYLLTVGRWLLPVRRSALEQATDTREYAVEMEIEPGGAVDGRTVGQARLRQLAGSFLVELIRDGQVHVAVSPDTTLRAGDRLVFVGITDAVRELRRVPGLRPATDQLFKLDGDGRRTLVELVLSHSSPAVGHTLVESQFRSHYNAAVIAISRHGRRLLQKPGDVVLHAGDTLLVETDTGFMRRHGTAPDFMMVNRVDGVAHVDRPRALLALALVGAMIVSNTLLGVDILWSAAAAAGLAIAFGCVGFTELRRSMDLRLIVVIAGSFALGAALQHTGVAAAAGGLLAGWAGADPYLSLALVYLTAVAFTELLTNNAAAVLVFPIALAVAAQLGVDPMPFVMAVMMGASAGFMTPIGYQTNLMIYAPGGYRFTDYLRVGAPLSLVVGLAVLWAIPVFWPF